MKKGDTIKVRNVKDRFFGRLGMVINDINQLVVGVTIEGEKDTFVYDRVDLEVCELQKPITKVTTANVRIMISHNYSNFEIAMQLENENGIEPEEVEQARKNCQSLAMDAVAEYKNINNATPAQEIERLENKIGEIKASIGKHKEITDPAEIAKVESLPLYGSSKKEKPIKIKK